MQILTSIEIDAPVETVWAHLVDFAAYPEWNPLTVAVEGQPEVDAVVKLEVMLGGKKIRRSHVISRVDAPTALCWTIRTRKPWLMRGERCQALEDLGNGRCRYSSDERVEGLSSWLVAMFYKGTLRRALEDVGEALKGRAEGD